MYLGIDFGTSGARAIAINSFQSIRAVASVKFPAVVSGGLADLWQASLFSLICQLAPEVRRELQAIAINGTSATVLICSKQGHPLDEPILYSDARGSDVIEQMQTIAPPHHTVISATSSLAKLLWWSTRVEASSPPYFLHQADWLGFLLHGHLGISDYHNALKLGYDVAELRYPDWLAQLPIPFQLPEVKVPGEAIAPILPHLAAEFDLNPDCWVCAGTTDSIAAFLASGARSPGEAVTSLGSTLVLKLLSQTRVDDARYGIYSHRLGDLWLVGGASNTGGAVLQQFFSSAELESLSQCIDPAQASPLEYYPLPKPGERFPINDPALPPRLDPRPADPAQFLQGLLEGIARIEVSGYQMLQRLGASPLTRIYTAGGGAKNSIWMTMRSRLLQLPVTASVQTEAAYGSALLAMRSRRQSSGPKN